MRLHQDLFDAASMTRCRGVSLQDYKQGLVDADCPNPLILALLLLDRKVFSFPSRFDSCRLPACQFFLSPCPVLSRCLPVLAQ